MDSKKNRCFDTKHNKTKAFIAGSILGAVVAVLIVVKLCVVPLLNQHESVFDPFILCVGLAIILLSAVVIGLKFLRGAVNTRIEITEKEIIITIGKSTQSLSVEDFVEFLPVNEYEYLDSQKFLVFNCGANSDSEDYLLPGMADEHYSYVLLRGVSNRQYRKLMAWLPAVLNDLNIEKDKKGMDEHQPLSYEKLIEKYTGNEKQ